MRRPLAILCVAVLSAGADEPARAQPAGGCGREEVACLRTLHEQECSKEPATLETCLVFLQQLETARRRAPSVDLALLLGETLKGLSQRGELPPQAQDRYLARARAAYGQAVQQAPFNAAGYLGLAELAETGAERVEWLRGAVRAEYQPVHMEMLANTLSADSFGMAGDLEAMRVFEDAYTYETTNTEKWRYGVSALRSYSEGAELYPSAVTQRSIENIVLRIYDDIDYPLLQRALLVPEAHLPYLADAFATLCEKSIVVIVDSTECMAGIELAVTTAEGPVSAGARRWLAEAALKGMRTIAGESPPQSVDALRRFPEWLMRLLATRPEPTDLEADLLEALADYTADLPERVAILRSAIGLVPNRGDLRLKAGATYVELGLWLEALDELRAAKIALPPDEHEPVDALAAKAEERYQAQFFQPEVVD